jgi:hypothetical protein
MRRSQNPGNLNAAGHRLQETYLAALGEPWHTQTLPAPPAIMVRCRQR